MDQQEYELRKQEIEIKRQKALEYRAQFLRENPEIESWIKKRKTLLLIVVIYWILHTVISLIVMVQMQSLTGTQALGEIVKLLFQLLWLWVFMNPQGGWRFNLILYFWGLANLATLLAQLGDVLGSLPYISQMPLLGVLMIMEILVPFLLFGAAIYLTAIPNHRKMSEQIETVGKQIAEQLKGEVL